MLGVQPFPQNKESRYDTRLDPGRSHGVLHQQLTVAAVEAMGQSLGIQHPAPSTQYSVTPCCSYSANLTPTSRSAVLGLNASTTRVGRAFDMIVVNPILTLRTIERQVRLKHVP